MIRKKDILEGVFCITVSYLRFVGTAQRVYSLCGKPSDDGCIEITRNEAKEIIKDYGLVLAVQNEHGRIYDTPDRAFYKKYMNWFKWQ